MTKPAGKPRPGPGLDGDQIPFQITQELWQQAEALIGPDPDLRDLALEEMARAGIFKRSAPGFYLLATRISDPDLEVRFHVIQELGKLLDHSRPGDSVADSILIRIQDFLAAINKEQLICLLEVAERYLSAEEEVTIILRQCSFAAKGLSAILNDRKLTAAVRQQAIYFCGQAGFLEAETALRSLLQRIDRGRRRARKILPDHARDEEMLYNFAVSALDKLGAGYSSGRIET